MSDPKIIGIGGIFFKSTSPEKLKKWYAQYLGLVLNPYGATFEMRHLKNPDKAKYIHWSAFPNDTEYFKPSEKPFMINYRVQGIEKLVEKLIDNDVVIIDKITTYPYGKFVHILDPEGNAVELWEPKEDFFDTMKVPTNK
ncbi:MAG: VOC family protein [Flavobacteriaceae bacterium]